MVGFYPTAKTPTVTQETVEDYKNAEIETRRGQRRWGVYWRLVKKDDGKEETRNSEVLLR